MTIAQYRQYVLSLTEADLADIVARANAGHPLKMQEIAVLTGRGLRAAYLTHESAVKKVEKAVREGAA